jgi:putative DNA primase/helicase
MALKSEFPGGDGFELFNDWSRTAPDRYDQKDTRDTWRSLSPGGGIGIGTLFHRAKANGYLPGSATWKDYGAASRQTLERSARGLGENEDRHYRQQQAASKAEQRWNRAAPARQHPYLERKGVGAHGVRVEDPYLLIPMCDLEGKLHNLQTIDASGEKRFQPGALTAGCHYFIGEVAPGPIIVCEGYATAASVHEASGCATVVAFSAGNLKAVALAVRAKFPDATIILAADDDWERVDNPGLTQATAAARAVKGRLAVPVFANRGPGMSDFNDLASTEGPEAVRTALEAAAVPTDARQANGAFTSNAEGDGWPDPQPLAAKVEPEPYPLDALPLPIRAAVEEVAGFVKAPVSMVASSALTTLSLACQPHNDVKRLEKLSAPTSLFIKVIADSGERKSTCDVIFTKPITDYEEAQAEAAKPALKNHRAAIEAWEAKRQGIKEKIRQLAKEQKPTSGMESALRDLEHNKPKPLRTPRLLYADATPEALAYGLAKQWPSGGVVSAEAGIVFGSHGMGNDSVMRNLGLLNQLWDGRTLTIDRRSTESFSVRGARLTMALQVQEPTLREFLNRSGALARGTGFLARFLVAWPKSTQGMRQIDPDAPDRPATWPHLAEFHQRIVSILNQPVPIDENGALAPPVLPLTPEAKAAWVDYHNAIESELSCGGEYYDVRDVASKSADNAARLAALFHMFEGGGGAIGLAAFESASLIAAWHLSEARRFFGELALPAELADAARLDSWLIEHCRQGRTHMVGKNHVRQHGPLRDGARLDTAIRELTELDRLQLVKDGKRLTIHLNPALVIRGDAS